MMTATTSSTVWIVQESKGKNLAPAAKFGQFRLLFGPEERLFFSEDAVKKMDEKLADFDPDRDYLVAMGDPVAIAVVSGLLALEHGGFRLLKWDRLAYDYVSVPIAFEN